MNLVEVLRKAANDVCFCNMGNIAKYIEADENIGGCSRCVDTLNKIADLIDKHYFPKPLFEDGEPVNLGDKFVDGQDDNDTVLSMSFDDMYFGISGNYGSTSYPYGELVKRPTQQDTQDTQQDIWSEIDEYLNMYSESYMQPNGNGVYESVKMIPLDVVDNAMYMLKDFYEDY